VTTRALVTGGNGFVAHWAIRAMLERGWQVTSAAHGPPPASAVLTPSELAASAWLEADVTDQAQVRAAVDAARPDVVLHLAAISHVPAAANDPGRTLDVNTVGAVRLLAEIARQRQAGTGDPVVLVVGSAEQYGRHEPAAMPLREDAEQRPLTLYAASKVGQEVAALQAWRSDGVRVVCTRSFSHSGVGHASHFLVPSLVSRGRQLPPTGGTLSIGNGATVRDFLHVRDVVDAYLALVDRGAPGEAYNVCSGEGVTVRALAERVLQRLGRSAEISTTAALARAVEVPVLIGDNEKLRRATGWAPRLTRDDIIDDLIHAATL
jgi:GDP-4-dehydro-6-deoxy-D-mannose reductase